MLLENYNLVSFDVFDTLLLRPYTDPQEVWRVLEEQENATGFADARKNADAVTYKKATDRGGETSIEEAYAMMPEQFRGMMQKEMEMERRTLRANPEMLDLWNKLGKEGKRCIIVSDMYLPKEFIESVLKENGFDGWEKFYLSRDYDCRKGDGKLFKKVIEDLKVKPHEILHIGDNEYSDVKVPESLGIDTIHYKKVKDLFFEECPFARGIDSRLAGALAVGWHEFKHNRPLYSYWNRLGYIMGGVLGYLYVSWIVKTAKEFGKNRLLFVARDGYVWQKICSELYPDMTTDYIYAPRLTSIAVLGAIGSDPIAIADRQRYMDKHLRGVDTDAIKQEYENYIRQFDIDDKCSLVDGCSSGFSAQRLVEAGVGHNVFCFYLSSMAELHHGAALYCSPGHGMQFQMLSEFLFGSSELPIKGIDKGMAVHVDECPEHEAFKISVADDIAEAAVACACMLNKEGVGITAEDWLSYSDLFMENLTEEDCQNLYKAKNAGDVEQKHFCGLVWKPYPKDALLIKRVGRLSLEITTYGKDAVVWRHVSYRGIVKRVTDISYKVGVVNV